jgi:hypothetical protein
VRMMGLVRLSSQYIVGMVKEALRMAEISCEDDGISKTEFPVYGGNDEREGSSSVT